MELPLVLFKNSSYGFYEFSNKLERWKKMEARISDIPYESICLPDCAKLCFITSVIRKWLFKGTKWLQNSPINSLFNNKI